MRLISLAIILLLFTQLTFATQLIEYPSTHQPFKNVKKDIYLYCSKERLNKPLLLKTNSCYYYSDNYLDPQAIKKSKYVIKPSLRKPLLGYAIPFLGGNLSYLSTGVPFNNIPYSGKNVRVAIIDTGINLSNPWFQNTTFIYLAGTYFNDSSCVYDESNYLDENGHGTHVAGIIKSVAPNVSFIILKLLSWYDQDIICAINKSLELNASIISMSLGGLMLFTDGYGDAIYDIIESYSNNTVFVVAAGNEGGGQQHVNLTTNASVTFINLLKRLYLLIRYYDPTIKIFNITFYNYTNNKLAAYVVYTNSQTYYRNVDPNFSFNSHYFGCSPTQCVFIVEAYYDYNLNITILSDKKVETDLYDLYYYTSDPPFNAFLPYNSYSTLSSPSNAPHAIAVGSIISHIYSSTFGNRSIGEVSLFSSQGPLRHNYSLIKPDIVAPGEQINSSYAFGYSTIMSGTSMATPFISGILALIKEVKINATPQQLRNYLFAITNPVTYLLSSYSKWEKGRGLINLSLILPYLTLHSYNYTNITFSPKINLTINLTNHGIAPYFTLDSFQNHNITFNVTVPCNYAGICEFNFTLPGIYNPYKINVSLKPVLYANTSLIYNISYFSLGYANLSILINNSGFPTFCNTTINRFNITNNYTTTYNLNLCEIPFIEINCSYDVSSNYTIFLNTPLPLNISYNITLPNSIFDNFTLVLNEYFNSSSPYFKRYINKIYYFNVTNLTLPIVKLHPSLNNKNNLSLYYVYEGGCSTYFLATYNISLPSYNFTLLLSNTSLFLGPKHNITLCYNMNHSPALISYNVVFFYNNKTHENVTSLLTNDSCVIFTFPDWNLTANITLTSKIAYLNYTFISRTIEVYYDGIVPEINLFYPIISLDDVVNITITYRDDSVLATGNFTVNTTVKQFNITYSFNLTYGKNTFYFYAEDLAGNRIIKNATIYYINTTLDYDNVDVLLFNETVIDNISIGEHGIKDLSNNLVASYINISPINGSKVNLILNFTIPEGYNFLYAYKANSSIKINITPLEVTKDHCLIYVNLTYDPEIGIILEKPLLQLTQPPTLSFSSRRSRRSYSHSLTTFYFEESKETTINTSVNESIILLEDTNITNQSVPLPSENKTIIKNETIILINNTPPASPSKDIPFYIPFIFSFIILIIILVLINYQKGQ